MSATKQAACVIADSPPNDGREWDCQCARCGSSTYSEECGACGGEGITGPGELYEQDPLWYDPDDYEPCHQCGGDGAWMVCMSTPEYCAVNPIPGREGVPRGKVEWYTFDELPLNLAKKAGRA
jgi:hypothetical protein